jgi:hypothetical protein
MESRGLNSLPDSVFTSPDVAQDDSKPRSIEHNVKVLFMPIETALDRDTEVSAHRWE